MTNTAIGLIGVDLDATVAGTGTSSDEGDEWALGTRVHTADGGVYIRVHAATAITQYDVVGVDENYEASALTAAMAGDGWTVGVSQVAASDNDFFWLAISGHGLNARLGASCAADTALRTTGTAGVLDDATGGTKIDGIVAVAANTVTVTNAKEVLLTWPRSATF